MILASPTPPPPNVVYCDHVSTIQTSVHECFKSHSIPSLETRLQVVDLMPKKGCGYGVVVKNRKSLSGAFTSEMNIINLEKSHATCVNLV